EIEDGKTEVLVSSDVGPIGRPQFSPDGKWISYSKDDSLLRSHVYVKALEGGEEHMIGGEDFLMSSSAKWTADGKKLLMLGGGGGDGEGAGWRPALYTIGEDGAKLTTVAQGAPPDREAPSGRGFGGGFGDLQWAKDGRSLYYLQGGAIYSVGISPSSGRDTAG